MADTAVTESRMNRYRVGDVVSFNLTVDDKGKDVWPPEHLEGPIKGFANAEGTYLVVDFGDKGEKTLTEDEVTRVA